MQMMAQAQTTDGINLLLGVPDVVIVGGEYPIPYLSFLAHNLEEIILLADPIPVEIDKDIYEEAIVMGLKLNNWTDKQIANLNGKLPEPDSLLFRIHSNLDVYMDYLRGKIETAN